MTPPDDTKGSGGTERAALSRELSDFLIELSIALHKHAMYPDGHPSLGPAADGVAKRLYALLQDRGTLSLGVARNQLVHLLGSSITYSQAAKGIRPVVVVASSRARSLARSSRVNLQSKGRAWV